MNKYFFMLNSAFELGEHIKLREVTYSVSSKLWGRFLVANEELDISFKHWTSVKYLNDEADGFSKEVANIPNDKGGLYLFYARCPIIPGITEFPFYIGRAQLTANQNLRKRIKEYFLKYARQNDRPKIKRMLRYWGEDLYVAYLPIESNKEIITSESLLINSLLLPMNDQIPDKEIRDGVKAF